MAVEGNRVWWAALMPDGLLEERLCCRYVAGPAEPEVDRLSGLVHRATQINPVAAYLDIGLVGSPRATGLASKTVPALDKLRRIPPNPPQDSRMRKTQSALGHHLDQIPKAEFVPQVQAHAQDDYLVVEVPPCKQLFNAAQLVHQSVLSFPKKITVPDRPAPFAPEPFRA